MDKGLTAVLLLALVMAGQAQDFGKKEVEAPVKRAMVADLRKALVETPLKTALRAGTPEVATATAAAPAGRVAWHASFEAALAAAQRSKKPVLLFQLLGRLDDEFC
jgi:hypothetical protein